MNGRRGISERYDGLEAGQLMERILAESHGSACITCSFQADGMVVLHMLRRHIPDIPVLFLDTGYHFAETYAYRDRMARRWKLNLVNLTPQQTVHEQEAQFGKLFRSDPGTCCHLRKVEPLIKGLKPYKVWFTGLRRERSSTRSNLKLVEHHRLPSGHELLKVNPLVDWDSEQVWSYMAEHSIEALPLYDLGFPSIGCEPCTARPAEGAHPRSGRWNGTKLECGIHTISIQGD